MLALLDTTEKNPGFLRGLTGTGGVTLARADVLRIPCAHITLAQAQNIGAMDRRLAAAVKLMRRTGIDIICFRHGFPHAEYFKASGFVEAGRTELYEAMAEQAAERLSRPGASVYLYAPRLSDAAYRTLAVLCRVNRLVMADVNGGTRTFAALRKSLGVSIVERPPDAMLATAEAAFILGVPRFGVALSDSCVVYASDAAALCAVYAARYVSALDAALPDDLECLLPDGYQRETLINEALRKAALHRGVLTLRSLTVTRRVDSASVD